MLLSYRYPSRLSGDYMQVLFIDCRFLSCFFWVAGMLRLASNIQALMMFASVVFASIYRFTTLFQFQTSDISWTLSTACTWCVVECSMGIISACLPTLRPLLITLSSRFNSSRGQDNNPSTTNETIGSKSGLRFHRLTSDTAFRPAQERLGESRFRTLTRNTDDASGDDVPLNAIMVQQHMTWETKEDIHGR